MEECRHVERGCEGPYPRERSSGGTASGDDDGNDGKLIGADTGGGVNGKGDGH